MQLNFALVSLLTLLTSTTHAFIEFEYYKGHACNNTVLSAVELRPKTGCVKLKSPGKSFHIGGPSSQRQIQAGCVVNGWYGTRCKGAHNLQIKGPSDNSACYVTGKVNGTATEVNSVELKCTS